MDHDQGPPIESKETKDSENDRKKETEREKDIVANLSDAVKRLIHKWGRPGISGGGGVMRVRSFVHETYRCVQVKRQRA